MARNHRSNGNGYSRPNQSVAEAWNALDVESMISQELSDVLRNNFCEIFSDYYQGLGSDPNKVPANRVYEFLSGLVVELNSEFHTIKTRLAEKDLAIQSLEAREASLIARCDELEEERLRLAPPRAQQRSNNGSDNCTSSGLVTGLAPTLSHPTGVLTGFLHYIPSLTSSIPSKSSHALPILFNPYQAFSIPSKSSHASPIPPNPC